MLDAIPDLCLFACVEAAVVLTEVARYTAKLRDILAFAHGAFIIKFTLETAVIAGIDGEVESEIGDIQLLKCVIDDALYSLGVGHKG